jgi:serine/threonine protein kinase
MTEREIFLAVLDLPDPEARSHYLEKVCGDSVQRARVEALLLSHDTAGSFLDCPAVSPLAPHALATKGLGSAPNLEEADEDLSFLDKPRRPDSRGRLGHYEMLQVLGRGGFGIVFRAFDDTLQRVVAVKVMAPQLAATSPARKRFLREARSSASVRHESVVQVYEVGEQPLPYLAMEFIPGETLQQKLDRSGPLDVSEVLRIGRQIAEGLAAAHASDLIHRDIKPGNILLESGSQKVKLTDFGLARAADDASISQSGIIAGTPNFMAPEQALGHPIDQRADLFSLGSVLYQMVSGRPPFRAPSALAVLKRVAEEPPRPIPEIIPETPAWLCGIIAKLHAKNPGDRFQSARQVADLLADCEAKQKAKQEVKNFLPPAGRLTGRKWFVAAAVLFFSMIALAQLEFAGVIHLFREQQTAPPRVAKQEPAPDTKPMVEVAPPAPTVHDTWLKAIALLPLDQHTEALPARMKERPPGFDDAFLRAIPAMSAERQITMAEAWLKERKPAFAGLEDAWLKAIPSMAAEAQAILVAAWLKERNPAFEGEVMCKVEGGALASLEVPSRLVQDLLPLRTLTGLRTLTARSTLGFDNRAESDAAVLRSLPKLETINGKPVAQFWRETDAKNADFKEWLQLVPALTAEQQVAAVAARLKEHNPDHDGRVLQHKVEDGVVTEFMVGCYVTDLSPVRALAGLKSFTCNQLDEVRGRMLTDISPLKDLKLTSLTLGWLPVSDLSPLKENRTLTNLYLRTPNVTDLSPLQGKPLTSLALVAMNVPDLSLLKGMPLTSINLNATSVTDLSALKGMALTSLSFGHTQVADLSPLQGMPLTELDCGYTKVADLSPLQGMPLTKLHCHDTPLANLSPLKSMSLEDIRLTPKNITPDLDILRNLKSLKTIGSGAFPLVWPAAEFWERYDKGEFTK